MLAVAGKDVSSFGAAADDDDSSVDPTHMHFYYAMVGLTAALKLCPSGFHGDPTRRRPPCP